MAKVKLSVWGYRCERCEHEWIPRNEETPRICPKCKSPYWDTPRRSEHPFVRIAREAIRTPDVHSVRIYGQYFDGKEVAHFDKFYKPEQIKDSDFELPKTLKAKMSVFGQLPVGSNPAKEMLIEDLNRTRKYLGLEPLPGDFVCARFDPRRSPPMYRLDL